MSILKSFCFCGLLKTGGMAIGMIGLVSSMATGIGTQISLLNPLLEDESSLHFVLQIILTVCVINLLVSFFLMLGTAKENPNMLLPWLIAYVLGIVALGIYIAMDIQSNYNSFYKATKLKHLTLKLVAFGTAIYFWFCIFSLHQELKNKIYDNSRDTSKKNKDESYLSLPPYSSEYI